MSLEGDSNTSSPPLTASQEPANTDASTLAVHLDSLIERYLNLLDTHQYLVKSADANFRSGLFSLAQANYRAPNRTRYGRDLYSDRMQASLMLESTDESIAEERGQGSEGLGLRWKRLETAKGGKRVRKDIKAGDEVEDAARNGKSAEEAASESDLQEPPSATECPVDAQLPTPPTSRHATPADIRSETTGAEGERETKADLPSDPIRQFGILVPPALRAAQGSFMKSTEGWIESVDRERQLQALELVIRRTRKRLRKMESDAQAAR